MAPSSSNGANAPLRVAIDIGGTFTDFVAFDTEMASLAVGKIPSNPQAAVESLLGGLERLAVNPASIEFLVHGTTVGLNAIVEGRGANVALVTTAGFRDVLEIGLMDKKEMYDLFYERPKPLVPRRRRFEVDERIDGFGTVVRALDEADLERIVAEVVQAGSDSVAVVTLNAYVNDEHERAIGARLSKLLEGRAVVSMSHEVANEWREFERTSTTVLNAYVLPVFRAYLRDLGDRLAAQGLKGEVNIMKSSGGIMKASAAAVRPIHSLLSGPVGGAVGARTIARRSLESDDPTFAKLVAVDMGGTSFDASLIVDGEIEIDARSEVAGYPMLIPSLRVNAIGAGGGSIARVVGSSSLRVGPESAGSLPGPACYGRGGTEPTVTDANVVLGRLGSADVLGGEIALDVEAATRAVREYVAKPLELDVHEAAEGILRVITSKMALAIRELTVEQGLDPREFALLAFGGAGPMHAAEIGAEIGIRMVVVPPAPGMFSAWGMLAADVRHDLAATEVGRAGDRSGEAIERTFRELEDQGRDAVAQQGITNGNLLFVRSLDLRYVGQEHTLAVPVAVGVQPDELKSAFDAAHRQKYGHASDVDEVEIVNLRVAAVGAVERPSQPMLPAGDGSTPVPTGERDVYFDGAFRKTALYDRAGLARGVVFDGPAIVNEEGATTVIPPGFVARIDDYGNLVAATEVQ
jgi:N-methylhydantoinase A